ncbi:MAG: DUF4339 domain-containing protein [Planctomyces sp.]|nr:DUF4339 domain-containing protein [Planctomyces sp.]
MSRWFYRIRNEQFGPVTDLGLAALLADGTVRPTDHVRAENETAWRPASEALSMRASEPAPLSADEWSADDLDAFSVQGDPGVATSDDLDDLLSDADANPDSSDLDRMLAPSSSAEAVRTRAKARPAAFDGEGWYYKSLGQELGPVGFSDLQHLALSGELATNDFVRPGEKGAWQRAGRVDKLFPEGYQADESKLKEAAAKVAVSSQRLGERGIAKLHEESATPEPKPRAVAGKEEKKPSRKKARKAASREAKAEAEDLAASILAEEADDEEEAPPRRSYAAAPARPATAAMTETMSAPTAPTPLPPTRPFTPPVSAPPAFQRGPRKSSISLPSIRLDGLAGPKALIAVAIVALCAGGFFVPWSSLMAFGGGSAGKHYDKATAMWTEIKQLHEKKASAAEWKALEDKLTPDINASLAELRPHTRANKAAQSMYLFEKYGLQAILASGAKTEEALYQKAEDYLAQAKQHLGK